MYVSQEVRLLSQLILKYIQHFQSLQGPSFTRGLSHDITFKGKVPQLRAELENIKMSHCCKRGAKMSVEFARPELCRCPKPKLYLSQNEFKEGKFTKRQPFMRMWPL